MREYSGDFETHLTINAHGSQQLKEFERWCQLHQLKCILILLSRGEQTQQPMAGRRYHATSFSAVLQDAQLSARSIEQAGFNLVRVKIEAATDNDDVPVHDEDVCQHPKDHYFEHHLKLLRPVQADMQSLVACCEALGAHLSRNAFRQHSNQQEERFVTLRSYHVGRISAFKQLHLLTVELEKLPETIISIESEYCVYDSNLQLDSGWLSSDSTGVT